MMTFCKKLSRRFRRDEDGATTVEFMVAMPLIVFWFAATYTFFDAYAESSRALKAAYTVADIVSRQTTVDDDYIDDMNRLYSDFMGTSETSTWVRISSIRKTEDSMELEWSEASGGSPDLSVDDIPSELIPTLVTDESVLLIETHVPFIPLLDYVGLDERTYSHKLTVSPRFTSQVVNTDDI